jgi:cytochrome P450
MARRPSEYLPERFMPGGEALAARSPAAFVPFGGGSRLCVGYKFALVEAKVALVRLYQR